MKKYNVIYADPPWSYDNKKTGGTNMVSGAGDQYQTMTNEDIMNMPIADIMQKNAVCFLWVTVPLLDEGMKVLQAWGFTYKTSITWRKIMSKGMGFWFRGQCEYLLVGVKGKVKPFRQQVANYWESPYDIGDVHQCRVGKHSQKPAYFRNLISQSVAISFEEPVKLELFARTREGMFGDFEYQGWDVYGNQVNNSITIPTA